MTQLLLTKAQVAQALACSQSTIDRLEARGQLVRVQLGGGPRWVASEVEALVANLERGASREKTAAAAAARRNA